MALTKEGLLTSFHSFFEGQYDITNAQQIPTLDDLVFGKEGTELDVAMLAIDIHESSAVPDGFRRLTIARRYKSFLWGATTIARDNDGALLSFTGDRVLVGFAGNDKCTAAARTALQLAWFAKEVLRPHMEQYLSNTGELCDIELSFGIGIDVGTVLVVRAGISGEDNNALVWVGAPATCAARLSALGAKPYHTHISENVYDDLQESGKIGGMPRQDMWEKVTWTHLDNRRIYTSSWTWSL